MTEILEPCPCCERPIDVLPLQSGDQVECLCGARLLMEHGNGFSRFYVIARLPPTTPAGEETPAEGAKNA